MTAAWVGWVATAVFATSYFFRRTSTLTANSGGCRLSMDRLWLKNRCCSGGGG